MMEIGVILPSVTAQREQGLDLRAAARHAEAAGLDGVWMGDHLATGMSTLDCVAGLATAAAVTERVRIGASVFVPAIRPLAWAAKQLASLQYLSGGRLVLGVGSGGGAAQWAAAGVPFAERGRRTDVALELLPDLLAGKPVRLVDEPGEPVVELAPAVRTPPLWVGNDSAVARRRAARFGDGWFPSLIPVDEVVRGRGHLAELAGEYERPLPTVTVGGVVSFGGTPAGEIADQIAGGYGMPIERARKVPITGTPDDAADRFAEYAAAGVDHLVLGISGGDWRTQVDRLAAARHLAG
ncbi:LLM class flavin-dependent oxidoreductase [Amycolatopsis magusensis]|uniref:Alkanesulfonate monooxygenase SsuD/methylene tetrahydromethanopterin reductase-like flavin-dependent oxidoreductase (Luciferase family) n=1 Tax=Amycolatopsis magusensis TaxID=882444 RepID=A0ABS4PW53_9PSEU|nr:LLM class flavin-dependent oxidoreductase [Amycolatopsis magusensis]MBP2183140.1 alkanesulfonate monooxygenase SsuD/methylene tetrahydromethanopterin reductase-like flavin-dependent oxidoreductase (luciferase family) [Amycolatopsis magusensis]MDI5975356.1 LLM class flavin-dependent oxidoreductase [Amycolatopsis magusensis]